MTNKPLIGSKWQNRSGKVVIEIIKVHNMGNLTIKFLKNESIAWDNIPVNKIVKMKHRNKQSFLINYNFQPVE